VETGGQRPSCPSLALAFRSIVALATSGTLRWLTLRRRGLTLDQFWPSIWASSSRTSAPSARYFAASIRNLTADDAARRIDHLDDRTLLALTRMFELVDEIVLVQSIGLRIVNSTVKILNLRPALSLRDGSIVGRGGRGLPSPPSSCRLSVRTWRLFAPCRAPVRGK
jgi:hypothetical protein